MFRNPYDRAKLHFASSVEPDRPLVKALKRYRIFTGGVLLTVMLFGWLRHEHKAPPLFYDLLVHTEGAFARYGSHPTKPFAFPENVQCWVTWNDTNKNEGKAIIGPFNAPHILRFWASGYPKRKGNELFVERADTHERLLIDAQSDVGERWRLIGSDLPSDWFGRSISLVAQDRARPSEWIGISEPVNGGGNEQLVSAIAAFSFNGLLFGIYWLAALSFLGGKLQVPSTWIPLVAAAAVAAVGYLAFWAYFAGPTLGKVFSFGVFAVACISLLLNRSRKPRYGPDIFAAARLLAVIGFFYVAVLNLFPSNFDYYALANGRWRKLPGDNYLPHAVAETLVQGYNLQWPRTGWLSSDRPPLQSGWMLLTWPFNSALGVDEHVAGGTAALWFQLLWVFACFGLLRSLGLSRPRACAWIASLSLCGFFILNSVFTWPKLSAAAFGCGVFGLWVLPRKGTVDQGAVALGGALAGLALLSHGGVAFSLIALVPWVAWRMRTRWKDWSVALLLFLILTVPWMAFQKFYAPPGNRLLKWHLAGQMEIDSRGTWQTLRESYAKLSWSQIVSARVTNLEMQLPEDWNWWRDFSASHALHRRHEEFFHLLPATTWWSLGVFALPIAFLRWRSRIEWRVHLTLGLWAISTLVVWCSLMFMPNNAVIHQGSYTLPIALFALLSAWLDLASAWLIVPVVILQVITFISTWAIAGDQVGGDINQAAFIVAAFALVLLAVLVTREHLEGRSPLPPEDVPVPGN